MSDVKVRGLAELNKFLQELPANLEANILRGALREGALVVEADAKARVPVASGRLRDSIKVTTRLRKGRVSATVHAGGKTNKRVGTNRAGNVSVVYDNPYYAVWVEYGTAAHKIAAKYAKALVLRPNARASSGFANRWMRGAILVEGVNHPGSKPKPFMRPALDAKAQEAVLAAANYMKKRLASKRFGKDTSGVEVSAG